MIGKLNPLTFIVIIDRQGLTKAFEGGSVVKNLPASAGGAGDIDLIPGWEGSPGGGNGNALQCSCLENPMDRGITLPQSHAKTLSSPHHFYFFDVTSLPLWLSDKESACNVGDPGLIPGLGRSPGEGHGSPLQYSCLENSMDRGAWRGRVHGLTKSGTRLGNYTFTLPPPAFIFLMSQFSSFVLC